MERFDRTITLIGNDNFRLIQNLKVAVVGLGGVGGYALESLARMGVLNLIIVDYDIVDITNINRQIIADTNTISKKKTLAFKERLLLINPSLKIEILDIKLDSSNIDKLFAYEMDYLIDACDDINVKKELIKNCLKKKIKFISSMGMGNKLDPSLIKITDIRNTLYDPLAKILRKYVKDNKIKDKIMVVSSTEKPRIKSRDKIGTVSYVASVAGLLCTSYVINDILKDRL